MAAKEIPIGGYGPRLLGRVEVAEGTMAFHFEKPEQFDFKPGQSADLTLSNPPETDAEGNTRTFSIASSPFENQLMFTTRMRDTAFKRSLKKMPLGAEVKIDSPMGSFTLHKNSAKRDCGSTVNAKPLRAALYQSLNLMHAEDREYRRLSIWEMSNRCDR